jgi:hypothetical protein
LGKESGRSSREYPFFRFPTSPNELVPADPKLSEPSQSLLQKTKQKQTLEPQAAGPNRHAADHPHLNRSRNRHMRPPDLTSPFNPFFLLFSPKQLRAPARRGAAQPYPRDVGHVSTGPLAFVQ